MSLHVAYYFFNTKSISAIAELFVGVMIITDLPRHRVLDS